MPEVFPTPTRSDRTLLVVSVACFAVAGVTAGLVDSPGLTLGATAFAVGGVYVLARYASLVSRRTLAECALGCWLTFLAMAGLHAVGLTTISSAMPGSSDLIVLAVTAVTWGTLLAACGTTLFLGFREYGSRTGCESPEERVLDGDTSSDY